MSLPTSYLTSFKNLKPILDAIQSAQAPKKFTQGFLEGLGFKNTADRLVIGVLKSLAFLSPAGEPTQRYYDFLDQTQGARVLAEGLREAYADLFQVNTKAYELSNTELKNKLKTLSQGQLSDSVLEKLAGTFRSLAAVADFSQAAKVPPGKPADVGPTEDKGQHHEPHGPMRLGGLVYTIQLHLPESRDPAVYDVLFKSLKEHLLR